MKIMITSVHKTTSPSFACYFGSQNNIINVFWLFWFTKQHHCSLDILVHKTASSSFCVLFWFKKQHHHHSLLFCHCAYMHVCVHVLLITKPQVQCACSCDCQATSAVCVPLIAKPQVQFAFSDRQATSIVCVFL